MSWKKEGSKLVYHFEPYKGWGPSMEVIDDSGQLYDMQNVRLKGNVISSRGGWDEYTADSGDEYKGLKQYISGGANVLAGRVYDISTTFGKFRYDKSGVWSDEAIDLANGEVDMTTMPKIGGKNILCMSNINENTLKWEYGDSPPIPIELTGTTFFENGPDNDDWDSGDSETSNHRRGQSALSFTGTGPTDYTLTLRDTTTSKSYTVDSTEIDNTFASGTYADVDEIGAANDGDALLDATGQAVTFTHNIRKKDTLYKEIPIGATILDLNVLVRTRQYAGSGGTKVRSRLKVNGTVYNSDGTGGTPAEQTQVDIGSWADHTFVWDENPNTTSAWTKDDIATKLEGLGCYVDPFEIDVVQVSQIKMWVRYYTTEKDISQYDHEDATGTGDEICVSMWVEDYTKVTQATSGFTFTDGVDTCFFAIDDIITEGLSTPVAFSTGWNFLVFTQQNANRVASGGWDDTNWDSLTELLYTANAGSSLTTYLDYMYIRKTSVLDEDNGSKARPPAARYCDVSPHGDRLLLAHTETTTSTGLDVDGTIPASGASFLWYSDSYNLDNFAGDQYVAFPEEITGLKTYGDFVHVFSEDSHWLMQPNYGASDLTSSAIDWQIARALGPGCVSHRSISSGQYNGKYGIFFLSKDGVYFTNGIESIPVSQEIRNLWTEKYSGDDFEGDTFNFIKFLTSVGMWIDDLYYLYYWATSDADNQSCIILDTKTGGWLKDTNSATVYPQVVEYGRDSNGKPILYGGTDQGDLFKLDITRTVFADDTAAYQSDFQTPYLGLDVGTNISWETLWLWVKSPVLTAKSLKIALYQLEDFDETTSYHEWEADRATTPIIVTTAFTPNTEFMWHRLRIDLDDTSTPAYPVSRGLSFKIYDDNDTITDYILEKVVATPLPQDD